MWILLSPSLFHEVQRVCWLALLRSSSRSFVLLCFLPSQHRFFLSFEFPCSLIWVGAHHALRSILEQLSTSCISMECSRELISLCLLYNTAIWTWQRLLCISYLESKPRSNTNHKASAIFFSVQLWRPNFYKIMFLAFHAGTIREHPAPQ